MNKNSNNKKGSKNLDYHDIHDRWIKIFLTRFIEIFLNYYSIFYDKNKLEFLNTEIVDDFGEKHFLDLLVKIRSNLAINIENQYSFPTVEKIRDILIYSSLASKIHNIDIISIIFCLSDDEEGVYTFKFGLSEFRFILFSLKNIDITKKLNSIESKINNNLSLSDEDLFFLMIGPYAAKTVEELHEVSFRVCNITINLEDDFNRNMCKYLQFRVISRLIKDEEVKKDLMRLVKMNNNTYFDILPKNEEEAYNEGMAEGEWKGKKEGKKEGIEEGKEKVALNLLKDGISKDDVCRFTGLSLDKINLLALLI